MRCSSTRTHNLREKNAILWLLFSCLLPKIAKVQSLSNLIREKAKVSERMHLLRHRHLCWPQKRLLYQQRMCPIWSLTNLYKLCVCMFSHVHLAHSFIQKISICKGHIYRLQGTYESTTSSLWVTRSSFGCLRRPCGGGGVRVYL